MEDYGRTWTVTFHDHHHHALLVSNGADVGGVGDQINGDGMDGNDSKNGDNNGNYVGNFEILHFWVCQSIESKLLAINLKTKKCLNINALVTEINQKYGAPYC
jgi:hypothetical protein